MLVFYVRTDLLFAHTTEEHMTELNTAAKAMARKRWADKTPEERIAETKPMRDKRWLVERAEQVAESKESLKAKRASEQA